MGDKPGDGVNHDDLPTHLSGVVYDAIPQLISAHTSRLSARAVRMLWDISILSLGFLLGSTVGLTTLITGFCLGPAIVFVSDHVKNWFE